MIEIPLTNTPEQNFSVSIDGVSYILRVIYNTRMGCWTADISQNGNRLVDGIALVAGIDILEQFTIPLKSIWVINLENPKRDPTLGGLGVNSRMFKLTEEETENVKAV